MRHRTHFPHQSADCVIPEFGVRLSRQTSNSEAFQDVPTVDRNAKCVNLSQVGVFWSVLPLIPSSAGRRGLMDEAAETPWRLHEQTASS